MLLALLPLLVPADVRVTTQDGSTLDGDWKVKEIEMTADFGRIEFDVEHVGRLELGEVDRVTLLDGRIFEGELDLPRIKLGKESVREADVATIDFLVEGRPALATDFTGEWMTSFGPMSLTQNGSQVTGTYGWNDEFKIEGTASGLSLEFEAKEPNGSSVGTFELWEDSNTFEGNFRWNDGNERFWGGYRHDPYLPAPEPGKVVEGQTSAGMNMHLHVPDDWDPKQKYTAILMLHGSNMSSRAYVDTILGTWPELGQRYVIVGLDGEQLSPNSDPEHGRAYNYSYVNFSGHKVGQKWRYNQSPGLVADAIEELSAAMPIDKWLVGGHSQGGFLTYAMGMFYSDRIAGVFPMACNLLVQCDPTYFDEEDVRESQRKMAWAPMHGQADPVVEFSGGEWCFERFVDGGFGTLRFFAPEEVGHQFAWMPVDEAVTWLDTMTGDDAEALIELARAELKAKRYRSATAAALRAEELGSGEASAIHRQVDQQAIDMADRLESAISRNRDADWVEDFWEFRKDFAFTPAASVAMDAYAKLRAEQAKPADEAYYSARRMEDDAARQEKYREIVERYYASRWYPVVKPWLTD